MSYLIIPSILSEENKIYWDKKNFPAHWTIPDRNTRYKFIWKTRISYKAKFVFFILEQTSRTYIFWFIMLWNSVRDNNDRKLIMHIRYGELNLYWDTFEVKVIYRLWRYADHQLWSLLLCEFQFQLNLMNNMVSFSYYNESTKYNLLSHF